ncbi:MAG: DNA recombination protein RmuC [Robiginitomaculum sp.]
MDPIISYSGLELTLVELILGAALLLLGALIAMAIKPARNKELTEQIERQNAALASQISSMTDKQTEAAGRLAQFTEDTVSRDNALRETLDARLSKVTERVGRSLSETQERNSANLKQLHERLGIIDRAQKNIETLSGEVSGLQSLLSNKQARGAFGEKQMQDLITDYLPPKAYTFQATLSNGKRVDALIHLPNKQGDVAVDSKFPMEAWKRLIDADNSDRASAAQRDFARDITHHIKAIADKYLIFGETHDIAMLFLPSEAIYAELHTNFPQVIEDGFTRKVMIVSPTTFMATLHTMRAVMKDAAMREQAHIIQREVGIMSEDVRRLDARVEKLQNHFSQSVKDVSDIRTSTKKIITRSGKIESLDMAEPAEDDSSSNIAEFPKSAG